MTFFFQFNNQGWTETYWSAAASYDLLLQIGKSIATRRADLLGIGARLIGLRVSDDDIVREALVHRFAEDEGQTRLWTDANAYGASNAWDAIRIRWDLGDEPPFARSIKHLRGVPKGVINPSKFRGLDVDAGGFNGAVDKWIAYMKKISVGIKVKNPGSLPTPFIVKALHTFTYIRAVKKNTGRVFDLDRGRAL